MDEKIRFVINANTVEDTLIGEDYETIGRQMEGQPVGPHRLAFMAARFMLDEQTARQGIQRRPSAVF
jgi:hypothetical protein